MVQRIASQIMGRAQAVLRLLCRHDHFVKGERTFMHGDLKPLDILGQVHLDCHSNISETRDLKHIFSGLYLVKGESSVDIGCRPEIVFSQTDCRANHRNICSIFRHCSSQRDILAVARSKSLCHTYGREQQRYEKFPEHDRR